eukprot:11480949-Alexandrium_andersonii.AAC.1
MVKHPCLSSRAPPMSPGVPPSCGAPATSSRAFSSRASAPSPTRVPGPPHAKVRSRISGPLRSCRTELQRQTWSTQPPGPRPGLRLPGLRPRQQGPGFLYPGHQLQALGPFRVLSA